MTWLNGIIGQGIASSLGANGQLGQAQAMPSLAQQAFNNNQQYYQQQAMAAQQALASGHQGIYQPWEPKKYRIDGQDMDFEEFVNTIYPDDCPEKTMLILKFKKED